MDDIIEYIEKLKSKKILIKFKMQYAMTLCINSNDIHIIKIFDRYIISNSQAKHFKFFTEDKFHDYISNLIIDTI